MREQFRRIKLGDRWGSINQDGQIFREPFVTIPRRRPEPIREVPAIDKRALSVEEIMDKFFKDV